jgi:hypothetical protein
MPEFPVKILDGDGGWVLVEPGAFEGAPEKVWIRTGPMGAALDAAGREELAQALVAACHEADRQAGAVSGHG